jgi:hypothetical protein
MTGESERKTRKDKVTPLRPPRPCPICGHMSTRRWHPFCSRRCADIDLNRWLKGAYAIPATEDGHMPSDEDSET